MGFFNMSRHTVMADKNKDLSTETVREIAREEIQNCFEELTNAQKMQGDDIKEIKEALLGGGNKYKKEQGLASIIQANHEYVRRSKDMRVIDRAIPAIEFFEDWYKDGKWKKLETIIENTIISEKLKVFFNLGSWAGIVAFITSIIGIIIWVKSLGLI